MEFHKNIYKAFHLYPILSLTLSINQFYFPSSHLSKIIPLHVLFIYA